MLEKVHDCKLEDFTEFPKKYKKFDELILQDIMMAESKFHNQDDPRLKKLIKLIWQKIQNHQLRKCRICFQDLDELRKQGRKVNQFCSSKCRQEYYRRKNEVFPQQVKIFGGSNPNMIWSEKRDRGYLQKSQRVDMKYTSRIRNKLTSRNVKAKKPKSC